MVTLGEFGRRMSAEQKAKFLVQFNWAKYNQNQKEANAQTDTAQQDDQQVAEVKEMEKKTRSRKIPKRVTDPKIDVVQRRRRGAGKSRSA